MKTTFLTNDYLLSILASLLVVLIIIPTAAIRLIIYIIDLKYKIKVKFNLFKFHQLASIEILKLNSVIENTKLFEIYIDRLWLSSCYLNRQVGDRIVLCLNNVSINYYIHQKDELNKSNKYLTYLTHFYIKYIGSLNIESLNNCLNEQLMRRLFIPIYLCSLHKKERFEIKVTSFKKF